MLLIEMRIPLVSKNLNSLNRFKSFSLALDVVDWLANTRDVRESNKDRES
jgi:hypothetical protein